MRIFFLYLQLTVFLLVVSGQNCRTHAQAIGLHSEFYSVEDGLSDRLVKQIRYISPGYLWLGTPAGLNKFNGYEFNIFNSESEDLVKLSNDQIKNLLLDSEGNLVITYTNNPLTLDILNPETLENKSIQLSPTKGLKGVPRLVFSDRQNRIFILTVAEEGLRIFELYTNGNYEEIFFHAEKRSTLTPVVDAIHLTDGSFFINDEEKGLRWFNQFGKLIKEIEISTLSNSASPAGRTFLLHEDMRGHVWFSFTYSAGLYRWKPFREEVEKIDNISQECSYSNVWEDQEGNLLFSQTDGIGIYPNTLGLTCYTFEGQWQDFSLMLGDATTIISVATSSSFFKEAFLGLDTGLRIVKNNRSNVTTLLSTETEEFERGKVIRGIDEDKDGKIYFAREVNYWYSWDPTTRQLDTLPIIDSLTGERIIFNCGLKLAYQASKDQLWGIMCDQNEMGRLVRYFPKTQKARTYKFEYKFSDFFIASDGLIWLLYTQNLENGGLTIFDPVTERFTDYFTDDENILKSGGYPRKLFQDSRGMIWIGTDNGLFAINPDQGTHRKYVKGPESLSSSTVYEIKESDSGAIMLGTTEGLNILNSANDSVLVYNVGDGLPNKNVCGILPVGDDCYWLSTFNGITYFEKATMTFKNFYQRDGFAHNEFNRFSIYRSRAGLIYAGGVNGLNIFDSEDLLHDSTQAQVLVTKFTRFDRRENQLNVQIKRLQSTNAYTIIPYDSYFQFDFTLNNFENPQNNQYSVWLKGYDPGYSFLGKNNSIRYYKLPPGNYQLYIRGATSGGSWSEPRVIDLEVRQVFYRKWWFISLLFILLGVIIYLAFKYSLHQRLRMERLRTKISSDLHDELSGLLAGIAIQSDLLKLKIQDHAQREKLNMIGEVSRKAISKMSDVIWSIDSRNDKVEDLLQRIKEHLMETLSPREIKYYINIKKINPKASIPVNIRQDLYFIFKEAINNVAKHSNAEEVVVSLFNDSKHFKMVIKDDGNTNNIPDDKRKGVKSGQGIANMRMRAHRLDAELLITNQNGYRVELNMPKFTKAR